MGGYHARPGLHVVMMGRQYAESWTRRVHNVKPEHRLGWTPYRIIIQSEGALPHKAFVKTADFRRWLGGHKVRLYGGRGGGLRCGRIV